MIDGFYFAGVGTARPRKTSLKNEFEDLLEAAVHDGSGRDWPNIRQILDEAIYQDDRPARAV